MITANHFLLDAVLGLLCLFVAMRIVPYLPQIGRGAGEPNKLAPCCGCSFSLHGGSSGASGGVSGEGAGDVDPAIDVEEGVPLLGANNDTPSPALTGRISMVNLKSR